MILEPGGGKWLDLWTQSAEKDVFAHPSYLSLFEDSKTKALAFFWKSDECSVLFPFLLRSIREESFWRHEHGDVYDITTPYGYGGPVAISGNPSNEHYRRFFSAFHDWAERNNIVSEFIRFSLFTGAHHGYPGEVVHNNDNIVCDLLHGYEDLWGSFRYKVRKNVAIALKKGVSIEFDPSGKRIDDFARIYYHTMQRRGAAPRYFWPASFFMALKDSFPESSMFFHAIHQGNVVASELVLASKTRIFSFMGGTLNSYFTFRAGDLLKNHIVKWAHINGFKQFVIGGGYKPHDGIFAFKQSFAPDGIFPFYIGRKIFNQPLYNSLVLQAGKQTNPGFFPGYRS
ncbi:MAG TPA: GNAT family N-acetyltransferase [Bacteroidales bacterium]|nr:GNAT family N-acetyltransferase [Bacteroidales bacterium]